MGEGKLMAKLVWRVKLVAELQAEVTTEAEVGPGPFDTSFTLLKAG